MRIRGLKTFLREQAARERAERRRQTRVLKPDEKFLTKYVTSYPTTSQGDTLDDKFSTLMKRKFAQEIVSISYGGGLRMSRAFVKRFPKSAEALERIFTK